MRSLLLAALCCSAPAFAGDRKPVFAGSQPDGRFLLPNG